MHACVPMRERIPPRLRMRTFHSAMLERKTKKIGETDLDVLARELSSTVVDSVDSVMVEEFRLSQEFLAMECTSDEQRDRNSRFFLMRSNRRPITSCKHRRPLYARTRIVTAEEVVINGVTCVVVKCSCGHFFQKLCACRHVYCLLDRAPSAFDVFPEKCKLYEGRYNEDQDFRKKCDERTTQMEHHQGVITRCTLAEIKLNPW